MYKINTNENKIDIAPNTPLLDALRSNQNHLSAPCNGNGTCGKCKVRVLSGETNPPTFQEISLLGENAIAEGYRLACNVYAASDMSIELPQENTSAQIVTEGIEHDINIAPPVIKQYIQLSKPLLEDQLSDADRILKAAKVDTLPLELIRRVPELLRDSDYGITLIKYGNKITGIEGKNTSNNLYGIAVDIGTTTIAAYLFDCNTGSRVGVHSLLNPQKIFGSDVISRIKHSSEDIGGQDDLNEGIVLAINDSINELCKKAKISCDDIYSIALVGNTTMLHFLLNVSARNIANAPFIPAFTALQTLPARKLGLCVNEYATAFILPSVSAYIGADTVGAVLATQLHQSSSISLLIDIGTNGEIVLGNNTFMYSCSSAAGPAFEGANIRNGMGSVYGAINSISLTKGLSYTTIGDTEPIGICGTGVVDAVAQLLEISIIDETGRINHKWKSNDPVIASLSEHISNIDGQVAFHIYKDIHITQKDIRELQNAKAAIAAGIQILIEQAGISFDDIENVYLAGGFGSYINKDSALKIGLIPSQLKNKIKSVGNAAGQGAQYALLSEHYLQQAVDISRRIEYIELSASKSFNDYYIDCMMFE